MGATIGNAAILDLRTISIAGILKIEQVENVRTVVLNPENAEVFMRIPRVNVRSHLILESEEILEVGQIEFNDVYVSSFPENTKLVLLGHALIDDFTIERFLKTFQGVRIYGQVLYSCSACLGALLARMERLQGQLIPMPPDAVRWIGETRLDEQLLASVQGRSVVSIGPVTIDEHVPPHALTDSIRTLTQIGEVIGSEEQVSALLSVCVMRLGTFRLAETPIPA